MKSKIKKLSIRNFLSNGYVKVPVNLKELNYISEFIFRNLTKVLNIKKIRRFF